MCGVDIGFSARFISRLLLCQPAPEKSMVFSRFDRERGIEILDCRRGLACCQMREAAYVKGSDIFRVKLEGAVAIGQCIGMACAHARRAPQRQELGLRRTLRFCSAIDIRDGDVKPPDFHVAIGTANIGLRTVVSHRNGIVIGNHREIGVASCYLDVAKAHVPGGVMG